MSFYPFMAFDPFLSFAESERGFREKIFLNSSGVPAETWYGADRDGRGYLSSLWFVGRDAYATVASKLDRQPKSDDFKAIALEIAAIEEELLPGMQSFIDNGQLALQDHRDSPPITCLSTATKDAPQGWILEAYMRMAIQIIVDGHLTPETFPDFEYLLSGAAVMYVDDCIIASQLGRGFDEAHEIVMVNANSAKLYRETVEAAKRAISAVGRRSATARHKANNERKHQATKDWETELADCAARNAKRPTMISFARRRHSEYFVTVETVMDWIREHNKSKN